MRHATPLLQLCLVLSPMAMAGSLRAELPPLIPRSVLFGNPDKTDPKISPDGRHLSYLAPDDGVMNVWVRSVCEANDRAVTHDRHDGIKSYFWAPGSDRILYIRDEQGNQNWHLCAVDLNGEQVRDLTPFDGVQTRIVAVEPTIPDIILIALNRRAPELHDVYRVNIKTGELTLEASNDEGFAGWLADHELRVRAAAKVTPSGGIDILARDNAKGPWRRVQAWGPEDAFNSDLLSFTADGGGLYVISSTGSNAGELREIRLDTGEQRGLAGSWQADVANVLIRPADHAIQAVAFAKERLHWKLLDGSLKPDFRAIKRLQRGDFEIIDQDLADRTWLVSYTSDDAPVYYYTYDRETRVAQKLFSRCEALDCVTLARMVPISFKARDGLTIPGYLTMPPGIPARSLPTVVLVRSSPWQRSSWGYSSVAQWLANRGYAVLQINFRGSTGYGKAFLNAANHEWGGKMQTDLIDGVNWAVRRGLVDPERIAIFGQTYGGYAVLTGLATDPEFFRCGVAISAPANLVTFLQNLPAYFNPVRPLLFDRVGDPIRDAEMLKARSPLFKVDRIQRPLLLAQGGNDPTVSLSESRQLVEAMQKAGKPLEYVEYANEGHGLSRPENRMDFFAKAEKFLAKHLGGRYEE